MGAVPASAQVTPWKLDLDSELKNPVMSPSGQYIAYGNEDREQFECLDAATGVTLWTMPLKDFDKWPVLQFVNDSLLLTADENAYIFVRPWDGSVVKTLPIIGDDWGDLLWEDKADETMDTLKPFHRASIGIYYFDDGFQIVDLEKMSIIMQSNDRPSKVQYKNWENVMMIFSRGGVDSIWFLDFENRTVIYRGSLDDHEINASLYQPFAMGKDQLLLFNEENVQSIDVATDKILATMPVETGDPDFFLTAELRDGLHLLVSEDDKQRLYRTSDGKMLWETPEGALPGVVDKVVETEDGRGLLFAYHDGLALAHMVDLSSGKIVWSRPVCRHEDNFEPGHKEGGKFGAMLTTIALSLVKNAVFSNGRSGLRFDTRSGLYVASSDRYGFGGSSFSDRERQRRQSNEMYHSFLSREKKVDAYVDLLAQRDGNAVIVVAGNAYDPSHSDWDVADGEGVVTVDLADGSVRTATKTPLISEKEDLNAFADLQKYHLAAAGATGLVGLNNVFVERSGKVEELGFGEQSLSVIATTDSTITIVANDDGDRYDYWTIDATTNPSTLTLVARSNEPNMVFPSDTITYPMTVVFDEYNISGHPLVSGTSTEATIATARWTLTEDDLEKLEVGRLTRAEGNRDNIRGIRAVDDGIFIMGEDAIAFVSTDGKCRWSHEWNPDRKEVTLAPTVINGYLVFAVGGHVKIVRADCAGQLVAEHEISFGDSRVVTTPNGNVVVLDIDDGVVHGYALR